MSAPTTNSALCSGRYSIAKVAHILSDFGSERASACSPALAEAFSIVRETRFVRHPFAFVPRRYRTGQTEYSLFLTPADAFSIAPTYLPSTQARTQATYVLRSDADCRKESFRILQLSPQAQSIPRSDASWPHTSVDTLWLSVRLSEPMSNQQLVDVGSDSRYLTSPRGQCSTANSSATSLQGGGVPLYPPPYNRPSVIPVMTCIPVRHNSMPFHVF